MPSSLFDALLPEITRDAIPSVASEKEATQIMGLLSNTCSTGHTLFMKELDKRAAAKLAPLLISAEKDNIKKAIDLVKNNPRLLLVKVTEVKDKAGRIIRNATPFQLAYGAGDDDLCLQLKPYFEQACGSKEKGEAEIRKQINDRFGKKSDIKVPDLTAVINAITNEGFPLGRDAMTGKWIVSEETLKAIEEFRLAFDASQPKIIDEGMHFDFKILVDVCRAYARELKEGWDYDRKKYALFEDGILSFILCYVPENDAAKFSQGLNWLQKPDQPQEFKRTLTTCDGNDFYDALRSPSTEFLLSGSCIDILHAMELMWVRNAGDGNFLCNQLQECFQTKMDNLATLCSEPVVQNKLGPIRS